MHRVAPLLLLSASTALAEPPPDEDALVAQARRRSVLRTYHRSMGITTWISLAGSAAVGTIRYANVVGFGAPLCAPGGSPILGRAFGCGDGLRIWHLVGAVWTTLSYAATRTLAALMPDPYGAASGPGSFAARLRVHRLLSWVHLAGMAAMPVLGVLTTAADDARTRDALATAHLAVGYSTLAVLSTAASLMAF